MYKILIADDDFVSVELLKELVETFFEAVEQSVYIDTAEDGQEAVRSFLESEHDIIFMDINMPIMDGFEAVRSIRLSNNTTKHPSIFMITVRDDKESMQKSFLSGVDWYVIKPYEASELELILNDLKQLNIDWGIDV